MKDPSLSLTIYFAPISTLFVVIWPLQTFFKISAKMYIVFHPLAYN